jgi:hypothetical protein
LPKAYLQFFAHQERKKRKIFTCFCPEKVIRYIPIDDICHKPFLYEQKITIPSETHLRIFAPNEIENSFVKEEGEYATLIRRIVTSIECNASACIGNEEKTKLAHFMSALLFRDPIFVHILNCFSKDEYSRHLELFANIKKKCSKMPESVFMAAYAHKNLTYYLKILAQGMCGTTDESQMVILNTTSSTFITSDRPVLNMYGESNKTEYDLIGMPITPNLFLAFVSTDMILEPIISIDDKQVLYINSQQCQKQTRYLLSNQKNIFQYIETERSLQGAKQNSNNYTILFSSEDIAYYEKIMQSYKD